MAKQQRDLLKDYFNHICALTGQGEENLVTLGPTLGAEVHDIHLFFHKLYIKLVLQQFQTGFQPFSNKFPTNFQQISYSFKLIVKEVPKTALTK